jgi:hypothetical protein
MINFFVEYMRLVVDPVHLSRHCECECYLIKSRDYVIDVSHVTGTSPVPSWSQIERCPRRLSPKLDVALDANVLRLSWALEHVFSSL